MATQFVINELDSNVTIGQSLARESIGVDTAANGHVSVSYKVHAGYFSRIFWVVEVGNNATVPDFVTYDKSAFKTKLGGTAGASDFENSNSSDLIFRAAAARESEFIVRNLDEPVAAHNNGLDLARARQANSIMSNMNAFKSAVNTAISTGYETSINQSLKTAIGGDLSPTGSIGAGANGDTDGTSNVHGMSRSLLSITALADFNTADNFGPFTGSLHKKLIEMGNGLAGVTVPVNTLDLVGPPNPAAADIPATNTDDFRRRFDRSIESQDVRFYALTFKNGQSFRFNLNLAHQSGLTNDTAVAVTLQVVADGATITDAEKFFDKDVNGAYDGGSQVGLS